MLLNSVEINKWIKWGKWAMVSLKQTLEQNI